MSIKMITQIVEIFTRLGNTVKRSRKSYDLSNQKPQPVLKGTGRPLDDLALLTGMTKTQVRAHVKLCNLPYKDALKYHLYFNRLPEIDKAMAIRHFGVDNLIEAVNNRTDN